MEHKYLLSRYYFHCDALKQWLLTEKQYAASTFVTLRRFAASDWHIKGHVLSLVSTALHQPFPIVF